jgi:oligoribonuclease NrnB/cAMP/cGMP phosphodiesterase (DHH superfamily)
MKDGMSSIDLKWTDEKLKGITLKYTKLSTFTKENPQAYNMLKRKGKEKFDEFTSHMQKLRPPFTDDELRKIALKYNNYTELKSMERNIESAIVKGIDPVAVKCAYSPQSTMCTVYAAKAK